MNEDIRHQVQTIKQELHTYMNGPVSTSLREKGLKYRIIYGVEWNRLNEIAATIGKKAPLANALWKEDIRECRLLAASDEECSGCRQTWISFQHHSS